MAPGRTSRQEMPPLKLYRAILSCKMVSFTYVLRILRHPVTQLISFAQIIDTVLYNNQSNPSAASSAYNAATSSAGSGGQQTGAVGGGGVNAPTETGAVGGQTSKSSAMTRVDLEGGKLAVQAAIAFVGVLGGAALLI